MMRLRIALSGLALGVSLALPFPSWATVEILKEVPPASTLPRGKIVYVDDGTCPAGEVKEITGGSQDKGGRRKVRCVKRPR